MVGRMTGIRGVLAIIALVLFLAPRAGAATYADLYNFQPGSADGQHPLGSLIQSGSALYGMTNTGGNGDGTIFSFDLGSGSENVDYDFGSYVGDGGSPHGSLSGSGSALYGLTFAGGSDDAGAIFTFNTLNNAADLLYSFGTSSEDGGGPLGSLIQSGTSFFGTAESGGVENKGVIFSYSLSNGSESILHSFGVGT
ncbi:MAG TPA: choice-of-anchor tandem repeat GloVer-containing protein, partial [Verrucomicrobiae bacterium]|nr:choice-of-anchor tandem repeat GloVer-containing protein [Verrucomicrobiae bacterium]